MDKVTQKERDRQWEEVKARRETVSLGKMSQQLISVFELAKLWLSLAKHDADCLVLRSDGSIYRGNSHNVKLDKMTQLQECYRTEKHTDFLRIESDLKSAEEMYPTAFSGGFRSGPKWDARPRLAPGSKGAKGTRVASAPAMPADDI